MHVNWIITNGPNQSACSIPDNWQSISSVASGRLPGFGSDLLERFLVRWSFLFRTLTISRKNWETQNGTSNYRNNKCLLNAKESRVSTISIFPSFLDRNRVDLVGVPMYQKTPTKYGNNFKSFRLNLWALDFNVYPWKTHQCHRIFENIEKMIGDFALLKSFGKWLLNWNFRHERRTILTSLKLLMITLQPVQTTAWLYSYSKLRLLFDFEKNIIERNVYNAVTEIGVFLELSDH